MLQSVRACIEPDRQMSRIIRTTHVGCDIFRASGRELVGFIGLNAVPAEDQTGVVETSFDQLTLVRDPFTTFGPSAFDAVGVGNRYFEPPIGQSNGLTSPELK